MVIFGLGAGPAIPHKKKNSFEAWILYFGKRSTRVRS
jgi:hypothetical protein